MKMQFLISFALKRVFAEEITETMKNTLQPAHDQPLDFTPSSRPTRSPRRAAPSLLVPSAGIFSRTLSANRISRAGYSRTRPIRPQSSPAVPNGAEQGRAHLGSPAARHWKPAGCVAQ